jgi:hypothetical protein
MLETTNGLSYNFRESLPKASECTKCTEEPADCKTEETLINRKGTILLDNRYKLKEMISFNNLLRCVKCENFMVWSQSAVEFPTTIQKVHKLKYGFSQESCNKNSCNFKRKKTP